jgi:NADPH2:quinone reductase
MNSDMAAMQIAKVEGEFGLVPTRRPTPRPRAGEVLIEVHAAGVNGHDVHQIHNGGHPLREGETDLPGLEVAGRIIGLGPDVERWKIGDRVTSLLRGGGYAEYAVAPQGNCLPVLGNLSWAQAAVLPETYFTVWSNVFVDCAMGSGETFLMNGGTSGIGVAAIQMAVVLGHRVFATARGPEKVKVCTDLGAIGIDYERESFPERIMQLTEGRGVDVILDIVAGDYLKKDMAALAEGGRVVVIGGARGWASEIDLRQLARRRLRVLGSMLRPRSNTFKAEIAAEIEKRIWPHLETGHINPLLNATFPLTDASKAIRLLEDRRLIGKAALIVRDTATKK